MLVIQENGRRMFAFLYDGDWKSRGCYRQWLHAFFNENHWFSLAIDNIIALENTISQNETSFFPPPPPKKKFQGQQVLIKLLDLDLIKKVIFPQHYWVKLPLVCTVILTQKNFHTFLMTVLWLPFFIIKLFIAHNMHC